MAKILMGIRSTSAEIATINLPQSARGRGVGKLNRANIRRVLFVGKQAFCITTMQITQTFDVVISIAATHFSHGRILL